MKCLYREQRRADYVDKKRAEYGKMFLEYIDQAFGFVLINRFKFGRSRLDKFYKQQQYGLVDTMEYYKADVLRVKDKHGFHVAGDDMKTYDALETAYNVFKRELSYIGFELDDFLDGYGKYNMATVITTQNRSTERDRYLKCEWYYHAGKLAGQAYIAGAFVYLHDTHGFGKARLTEVYNSVKADLVMFLENFFSCTDSGEKRIKAKFDEYKAVLIRARVPLEDISTSEASKYTEPTTPTLPAPPERVSECERILSEVRSERKY